VFDLGNFNQMVGGDSKWRL